MARGRDTLIGEDDSAPGVRPYSDGARRATGLSAEVMAG